MNRFPLRQTQNAAMQIGNFFNASEISSRQIENLFMIVFRLSKYSLKDKSLKLRKIEICPYDSDYLPFFFAI